MREYLKAIGFSDLNSRKKIDELINEIKKNPSRKNWFQIDEEEAIFIYEKDFAEAAGIAVIEVMDRDGYRVQIIFTHMFAVRITCIMKI